MVLVSPQSTVDDRSTFDLVVAANRLPVDRVVDDDGTSTWQTSPGGLVTAMDSVMEGREAAWVGWAGDPGESIEPFARDGVRLQPLALSADEIRDYYEGFCNGTLWPLYHDVIVQPHYRRSWWAAYRRINQRFAEAIVEVAAHGATVWVHDYQLQLVPALLRDLRPDLRIGWFNHIPFPSVELFGQLPWRASVLRGLLGADFLGFQRATDAGNFARACHQLLGATRTGDVVSWDGADDDRSGVPRRVRVAAVPISIDFTSLDQLARTSAVRERAREIRASLGNPETVLLGIDRLDYTKGIRHRLRAYSELLADGDVTPTQATLLQIATPSRERVSAYRELRAQIDAQVGRINGDHSVIGAAAVEYLHHSYPKEEMAALFLAADVLLVTPLRDGMNLVAKEYVASRWDGGGALVLSEFTGAAHELSSAFLCNPHDIAGLKRTILEAMHEHPAAKRKRMLALRRRVRSNDVFAWARKYLAALEAAPAKPGAS
ncbi:alpha,alpha-trehalose-phosphate synthase (UDP-forming) [Ornithinimicrobium cryptoxanthini]|uniref:alpha,alpha-trehalose-phosphate synthase (UDP-forming) n=1 Tax=Ornithinimicrobium cryptoxanthini TaxID=2934161 RepID=UPI00351BEF2B